MNDLQTDHVLGEIEQDIQREVEDSKEENTFDFLKEAYELGKTSDDSDSGFETDMHKLADIGNRVANHYYKLFKE